MCQHFSLEFCSNIHIFGADAGQKTFTKREVIEHLAFRIPGPETDVLAKKAKQYGIPAGIHTNSVNVAVEMIKEGFQLVSLQSDDRFLMSRAKQEVEGVRNTLIQK